jgi:hypothetical protein
LNARKYPRIRPYRIHSIGQDGARSPVKAHELVMERPQGIDLEINLAPHPGYRGLVSFSTFRGNLVVEPHSGSSLHIFVEDWPRGDPRRKKDRRRTRTPLCHIYAVDVRGEKKSIAGRRFAIDVGRRSHELEVNFTPPAPWAHHVYVESVDHPLVVHLIAANVIAVAPA